MLDSVQAVETLSLEINSTALKSAVQSLVQRCKNSVRVFRCSMFMPAKFLHDLSNCERLEVMAVQLSGRWTEQDAEDSDSDGNGDSDGHGHRTGDRHLGGDDDRHRAATGPRQPGRGWVAAAAASRRVLEHRVVLDEAGPHPGDDQPAPGVLHHHR